MVSTTERELKLEELGGSDLKVSFLGFFGNFFSGGDLEEGNYQNIAILFSGVVDRRYFPDFSKEAASRIDGYDWERVPEFRDENGSLAGHEDKFNEIWKETGICPNPSVYQVEDSDWAKSIGSNITHYLVLGGDYNLEVLADSCNQ